MTENSVAEDWESQAQIQVDFGTEPTFFEEPSLDQSLPAVPVSTRRTITDIARFSTSESSQPLPVAPSVVTPKILDTLPELQVPEPGPMPTPTPNLPEPSLQRPALAPTFPSVNSVPVRNISARRTVDAVEVDRTKSTSRIQEVPQEAHPRSTSSIRMSRQQRQAVIASRGTLNGFKGFCPVELQDHRVLLDSHPHLFANHGTRTYYFSTSEARDRFLKNPAKYVPAAEGIDVVDFVDQNAKTPGRLDYAQWFQNRLYLFASAHSMQVFNTNPSRYANP